MITVIIPIHDFNETIKTYLTTGLNSIYRQLDVENSNVFVVHPTKISSNIISFISEYCGDRDINLSSIENTGNFDFQSQVNFAANFIKTPYFSILEFDDEYSEIYFKNAEQYIKAYPDVDLFLPITVEVDINGRSIGLINDMGWSRDFVGEDGEQGFLNIDSLKRHTSFSITGGIYKIDSFINAGKLKKNIKLTFGYEYLLRVLNSGQKVMIIPKAGYKHVIARDGSLFLEYTNTINMKQRKFWFDTANKEYYFPVDREIDLTTISTT